MDMYAEAFVANQVDGQKLLSPDIFTEQFVLESLGVSNKLHAKKLATAARKLQSHEAEQVIGDVFDSGTLKFTLGEGKVIRGWEMGIATMAQGERAELIMRSDFCYGKNGFRRPNGEVVVAPFSTLKFDVKLLSCTKYCVRQNVRKT